MTPPRSWSSAVDAGPGRRLRDRSGETVDVESEFVYPLIKGADLRRLPADRPRRAVLVTQRKIGEDTTRLAYEAPKLWAYLGANADRLERRKSSIYRGQPPFALFGVGPYSFAPFKVAICGLHKNAGLFRAVGPVEGRPVMLDDTCYFLACSSPGEAAALTALCNDPILRLELDPLGQLLGRQAADHQGAAPAGRTYPGDPRSDRPPW